MDTKTGKYKVEVKTVGDSTWNHAAIRFETREIAENYARDLERRWLAVTEWKVTK